MSRPSPKKNKRRDRRKRRDTHRNPAPRAPKPLADVDLRIPRPDLAHPPVFIDGTGTVVPSPYVVLGLDADARIDADEVQSAFRAAIEKTSPESDPARARDLLEARNTLLDPKLVLRRALGDLRAPRTECFLPDHESRETTVSGAEPEVDWSSRARLVAAAALFALLESEIENDGAGAGNNGLFDS